MIPGEEVQVIRLDDNQYMHLYTYKDQKRTIYYDAHGNLHRVGGPAVIHYRGAKEWWRNGLRHNSYGPSYINNDYVMYHLDGVMYATEEKWFSALSDSDKVIFLFGSLNVQKE